MHSMRINFIVSILVLSFVGLFGQENGLSASEEALIGEHMFGVQFIWDGYGSAVISRNEAGKLIVTGAQYSSNEEEYVLLNGTLRVIDERNFVITGHLKLFTADCCGLLDRDISYTFRKTGNRKYWRLKERDELCSAYTCAYYMDIFE